MTDPIGKQLRAAREARGLTQEQLAARLGCAHNTVSLWELGKKNPTGLYRQAVERFIEEVE